MKKVIVLILGIVILFNVNAQKNNVLLEIDDEKITVEEFLHIYKKNNTSEHAMKLSAMQEYMDLFINFKLKVHEAKNLGLDESDSFNNELRGYRNQLAQPYLTDKELENELIKEAYQRMKYDVEVSHILIKIDPMAAPEDTLKAYNKIKAIHQKLKKGEDFDKIALEFSEDESVTNNSGNLGYRTVFGLVYPFETAMYTTPVGEYSEPFRTNFGYHVLKVTDKRPAKGRYKVAHIMLMTPMEAGQNLHKQAEKQIFEIHDQLNNGADFAEMANEHSQDRRTAERGGELGWVTVGGKMIQAFENAVFEMSKVGEISKPLKTGYGWHIIKVLEIEPIKEFDEVQREIKSKISNTARATKSKESVIAKLKKEYNVVSFDDNYKAFYKLVTDSIFEGSWKLDENIDLSANVLQIRDVKFTQDDFYKYLLKYNRKQQAVPFEQFVDSKFLTFIDNAVMEYEESVLEEKYPEFKYLINEYHDGILLFELTDLMVWSKAINDTIGLEQFWSMNKENYMWGYRYQVEIFDYSDEKTGKKLNKSLSKGHDTDKILSKLNRKNENAITLSLNGVFEKGSNVEVDELIKDNNIKAESGITKIIELPDSKIARISVVEPEPKTLNEARGLITADYQNYLEKEWVKELRSKYNIKLHNEVLKSIAE
jgi:peptidyl-prolyl cis-trans isomerase SurA